jgi:glycosyltransferase involved in cell wall biosynthesis
MTKVLMLAAFAMEKHDAELIHFSSISNGLKRLGYDVTIYHLSKMHEPAIKDLLNNDIEFHETFIKAKTNNEMFIKGILAYPLFLISIIRNKPDIIYSRLGIVTGIFIILTKLIYRNRIKTVTEHNGWIGPEAKTSGKPLVLAVIGTKIQKLAANLSDRIRVVSKGVGDYLISMSINNEKIFTIGNGTDITSFRVLDSAVIYDFGFIGNLAKWQGTDILIDSFTLLVKKYPYASLAIAGSGPDQQSLIKKINDLQLSSNVFMVGSIHYNKVNAFINSCRICVAPKLNFVLAETSNVTFSYSPLKIRDYAACGKPIISSRIAGLEEIEEAGFGILVEPGNVEELKDAMISLLDNPDRIKEMGQKARQYAEKNYSWDIIARKISEEILQPLV